MKKNALLDYQILSPDFHEDHYLLYEKYITQRHADGDMYPPSREQYRSFLVEGHSSTEFVEFSLQGQLVGIAVIDRLLDGISAIYTFFDPDFDAHSIGTFAVLWQIDEAKRSKLPFVYLGYFIAQCQKMNYKINFKPFEARIEDQWLNETELKHLTEQSQ